MAVDYFRDIMPWEDGLYQARSKQFLIGQAKKWVWLYKWACPIVGVVISNGLVNKALKPV